MTDTKTGKASAGQRPAPSAPPESAWAVHEADARPHQPAVPVPLELKALADEFRQVLEGGVHGLCFSPYLEGQAPGSLVGEAQILRRLEIIQPYTNWIRTFSCTDGHQHTPRLAQGLGMKTLVQEKVRIQFV